MARNPEKSASNLYESFHRYAPKKIGEFNPSFAIPSHVHKQGKSINVLYRSTKVDPETLKKPRKPVDYIHDHEPGVHTYLTKGAGERVAVPAWIRELAAITLLGQCLGFEFENPDGKVVNAEGRAPLPELYATPNGKALLVIDGKRTLIALMWGGKLDVEPRGIVG